MNSANSAGKTTIADAAYLAHTKTFPRLPRPSAAGLGEVSFGTVARVQGELCWHWHVAGYAVLTARLACAGWWFGRVLGACPVPTGGGQAPCYGRRLPATIVS
jgi:hypothetical protein